MLADMYPNPWFKKIWLWRDNTR